MRKGKLFRKCKTPLRSSDAGISLEDCRAPERARRKPRKDTAYLHPFPPSVVFAHSVPSCLVVSGLHFNSRIGCARCVPVTVRQPSPFQLRFTHFFTVLFVFFCVGRETGLLKEWNRGKYCTQNALGVGRVGKKNLTKSIISHFFVSFQTNKKEAGVSGFFFKRCHLGKQAS